MVRCGGPARERTESLNIKSYSWLPNSHGAAPLGGVGTWLAARAESRAGRAGWVPALLGSTLNEVNQPKVMAALLREPVVRAYATKGAPVVGCSARLVPLIAPLEKPAEPKTDQAVPL